MGLLDGKVAVLSGAARGEGEAVARAFAGEGAMVVLGDVGDEVHAVAASIGAAARSVRLDVSKEEDWVDAIGTAADAFGGLDVLVNSAGILRMASLVEQRPDEWWEVVRVNQVGCFLGMRAAVGPMRERGGGSIVNVSSTKGIVGGANCLSYVASNFAIRGMTRTAAMELGPLGIRVNSIHPGVIDTELTRGLAVDFDHIGRIPLGRMGRPGEVADLAVFLASDESAYSTGSEFVIDGGLIAGLRV